MFKDDPAQTETTTSVMPELLPAGWPNSVEGRSRAYTKGELILIEGDAPNGLHIIRSGEVKVYSTLADGKPVAVDLRGPGRFLGLGALVLDAPNDSTAEALCPVETSYMPPQEAKEMLEQNSAARWVVLQELARNHRYALAVACSFAQTAPALTRLARLILGWTGEDVARVGALDLENRFTHQQIADMLGTTRETVTRGLSELRARGIVTMRYTRLVIHDVRRLRAVAKIAQEGCDGAH